MFARGLGWDLVMRRRGVVMVILDEHGQARGRAVLPWIQEACLTSGSLGEFAWKFGPGCGVKERAY